MRTELLCGAVTTAATVAALALLHRQRRREAQLLAAVRTLARYNAWTNELLLDSVDQLPTGEAAKQEHGYTARNTSSPPALSSLRSAQRELDDWLIRWADAARFDELFERRRFTFVGDREPRGEMTAFEMLVHIVNHTTYHRGWAVQMMMEPGKTAPATTTDLPVYCRDVGRVPA
jgi:uncharacterized damage-inducible protein DinB